MLATAVSLAVAPLARPDLLPMPRDDHAVTAPFALREGLLPISPEQAKAINLSFPEGTTAGPPAVTFTLPAARTEDYRRALNCLTMAIYYEAGQEAPEGQRAVAQVILNRVRHPAFPNSVCGVVFQGSERTTGCQFTFTCDGSRARIPAVSGWQRALRVAAAALAGEVYPQVGWATHYHADYVLPYWAPSLTKSARVGAHVFYRWPGGQGTLAAFRQGWSGREPDAPPFRGIAALPYLPLPDLGSEPDEVGPPEEREVAPANVSPPRIRADERSSGLVVDERAGELVID